LPPGTAPTRPGLPSDGSPQYPGDGTNPFAPNDDGTTPIDGIGTPGGPDSIDGSTGGPEGGTGSTGGPDAGGDPDALPGEPPGSGAGGPSDSPVAGSTNGRPSGDHGTWGPLTSTLTALGISGPSFGGFGAVPTLVTTTGAVAMAMAFGLFGKRRRDGEPPAPDEALAMAAAAGVALGAMVLPLESDIDAAEAMLPRWRRPSLLQARRADPIRDATPAARLTFDQGLVGPLDGHERRLIRYRVVRMLDTPDELRGTETGYLDRGDEVQLLEKYGAYWRVLCPDGRQGWVHNMTLGDVVNQVVQPDRPVATMPLAAETWTMGESDDDTDVLEAYLESRRLRD
jgi:hypothetical protein